MRLQLRNLLQAFLFLQFRNLFQAFLFLQLRNFFQTSSEAGFFLQKICQLGILLLFFPGKRLQTVNLAVQRINFFGILFQLLLRAGAVRIAGIKVTLQRLQPLLLFFIELLCGIINPASQEYMRNRPPFQQRTVIRLQFSRTCSRFILNILHDILHDGIHLTERQGALPLQILQALLCSGE